jgi:hypothetical protein
MLVKCGRLWGVMYKKHGRTKSLQDQEPTRLFNAVPLLGCKGHEGVELDN